MDAAKLRERLVEIRDHAQEAQSCAPIDDEVLPGAVQDHQVGQVHLGAALEEIERLILDLDTEELRQRDKK